MKWATIFEQVAARPEAIAEIAGRNGLTTAEIVQQVERQTSCAGSNYDLARKAKEALDRQAKKPSEADQADREASRRSEEAKKREEELRKKISDEIQERVKKAAEDQAERDKAKREQAQRDAQRSPQSSGQGTPQRVSPTVQQPAGQRAAPSAPQSTPQRASPAAQQQRKPRSGCSRVLKLALGAAVLLGALLVVGYLFRSADLSTGGGTGPGPGPTVPPTCAPLVMERHKCPWTPEGFTVEPCGPGFCWDGGPQGSLACKQEVGVENSHQSDLSVLVCNDGYYPERDPCTNVILRCVKQ